MEYKAVEFKADSVDMDERTFEGYASTWDLDQGGDIIVKGAFAKTLMERASRVKVLYQHDAPIGKPVLMREDDIGLFVQGKVSKTQLGDEALELMRDGVIDQMSIGYSIPTGKSEFNDQGIRIIRELKLYEFSPVTFAMNDNAFITGVKSIQRAIKTGAQINNATQSELIELLDELKALISKSEPGLPTLPAIQPQQSFEIVSLIKSFGR
jgi:HK97 family phage prohead protease